MLFGFFSDAHGNAGACESALETLTRAGAESLIFLGDAVGYLPTKAVIRQLMARPDIDVIVGNHEAMLLARTPLDAHRAMAYKLDVIDRLLEPVERAWLSALPGSLYFEVDGWRMLCVHGSPIDPTFGYVYPDTDLSPFADCDADIVFMGNTHRPFVRTAYGKLFVNVGSCGLPRDDDVRGSAALFDTNKGAVQILRFSIAAGSREALSLATNWGPIDKGVIRYLERQAAFVDEN